jgi:hypothetical protein
MRDLLGSGGAGDHRDDAGCAARQRMATFQQRQLPLGAEPTQARLDVVDADPSFQSVDGSTTQQRRSIGPFTVPL